MINNRQSGRRRGRGGGQRSPNNVPSAGSRQDNRQRGNAAQLHEKYKALARDAQLAGDRVQTEFYLQFADHYFRVLNEGRARFEEQRRPRDDFSSDEGEDQDEMAASSEGDGADEREEREERQPREERRPREARRDQGDGGYRNGAERPQPPREPREPRAAEVDEGDGEERISLDVLPPAIAADTGADAPRGPRRRTRRPRPEGGDAEIAPAA